MKRLYKTTGLFLLILVSGLLASCATARPGEEARGFLDLLREFRIVEASAAYPWPAAFIWGIVAWVVVLIIVNIPIRWAKPKPGSESRPTFLEILQDVFGGTEKARKRTARVSALVVYAILVLAVRGIIDFFPGGEPSPPREAEAEEVERREVGEPPPPGEREVEGPERREPEPAREGFAREGAEEIRRLQDEINELSAEEHRIVTELERHPGDPELEGRLIETRHEIEKRSKRLEELGAM